MIFISSYNSSTLQLVDNENKCWIHTVDYSLIKDIDKNNLIGFKKNENTKNLFKKFFPGNEIFLVTRDKNKFDNKFVCYGYTIIENIIPNEENLYEFYENRYKLKIKRIKYFLQPIFIDELRYKLKSIKSDGRISDVLNVGYYKEISFDDNKIIKNKSQRTGMFPVYFEGYSKDMKEFMLDTCKSIYNILKNYESPSQIEINKFILLLQEALNGYGITKNFDDLKRFYSRYAYELGFKHVPSSDSDKFVVLLSPSGEKRNYVYINLE